MAKWVHTSVLDAALDKIATSTSMSACNGQPANRTEATTTYNNDSNKRLAQVTISGADFTKAAGTGTSARKTTVAQKTGVTVDSFTGATNAATHVALCDASNLLYVTTCTSQALTAGNTLTFNSWTVEFSDPT